jgi:hypothetical protein
MRAKVVLIVACISVLAMFGESISLVQANPYQDLGYVPPDQYTLPPKITVIEPINNSSFATDNIALTINASLPESPKALNTFIWSIVCQTDWSNTSIEIYKNIGFNNSIELDHPYPSNHYYYGTTNIANIPSGQHELTIIVVAGGLYDAHTPDIPSYYRFKINETETVSFSTVSSTTDPIPTSSPSVPEFSYLTILPIVLTIPIVLVIVRKRLRRNV